MGAVNGKGHFPITPITLICVSDSSVSARLTYNSCKRLCESDLADRTDNESKFCR